MKKIVKTVTLMLVLAMSALLFASCANKEKKYEEWMASVQADQQALTSKAGEMAAAAATDPAAAKKYYEETMATIDKWLAEAEKIDVPEKQAEAHKAFVEGLKTMKASMEQLESTLPAA